MTAQQSIDTVPDRRANRASPRPGGRRRPAVRWVLHGVLLVALAAGVFGLLPRLGGLTRDAAGLRHARPAFVVAAVVAQAISLGCYAQLYRRVLTALGAKLRATAVLAVLGYRIVNYWLPLFPGAVAYLRLRLQDSHRRPPSTRDTAASR